MQNHGGRIVLATDGYFIYGSDFAPDQQVESG